MFRKFQKSKEISLTCPYCGHVQNEPALVISSFCQKCGEHFRVRKGKAVPNPSLRVSGISEITADGDSPMPPAEVFEWKEAEESESPETSSESWVVTADDANPDLRPLTRPGSDVDAEETGISAGAFFGLAEEDPILDEEETDMSLGEKAQSREQLAEGSFGALIDSQGPVVVPETGKMPPNFVPQEKRRKSADPGADFEVRCFRCYHKQMVSRFAKSTQCERCSVYISLANYEVRTVKSHPLRTRGDITIGRRGGLRDCEIACHHLTVNGSIDAFVDCSGDAVFRSSGIVRGNLFCRKLMIEKNCEVTFPDGVLAERAEIQGKLLGDLTCSGLARVSRSGWISGDLRAVDIEVKEGGKVEGETKIDPDTTTDLPVKMGFNPSIIN
ncbi:MAG: polymer-forming cytoskeletal protein [Verrucomicrobiota bacterium]